MDRAYIDREQIIARYLADRLSAKEREAFEAYCIAHPQIAEEVELEARLRRGLQAAAERRWICFAQPQRHWRALTPAALAASVALVLTASAAALWLVLESRSGITAGAGPEPAAAVAHRVASSAHLVRLGGGLRSAAAAPDHVLQHSELPEYVVFETDVVVLVCADGTVDIECADGRPPASPRFERYRLEILDRRDGELLWQSAEQVPASSPTLAFIHEPRELTRGDYDVLVRGLEADRSEVVARFWLRVSD